ncbi:MAG TPA: cupin domain-containing protein [Polyangiales bacterium]|jgi:1,2-dihydroxy-3-keto-5-methylthiopentene dioxygenase|nr:cupin domain-containing protein [Polyangiales bacterium]
MKAHWLDSTADSIATQELVSEGVAYQQLSTAPASYRSSVDMLKADRGYVEEDIVELSPSTPNLDAICAKFVDEHHHDEDEVRFVLEGEGIFDIRSNDDRWMRIVVQPGDLIVVPAGRHHRFLLTDSKHIRCVRMFRDASGWVPHYRAAS